VAPGARGVVTSSQLKLIPKWGEGLPPKIAGPTKVLLWSDSPNGGMTKVDPNQQRRCAAALYLFAVCLYIQGAQKALGITRGTSASFPASGELGKTLGPQGLRRPAQALRCITLLRRSNGFENT